MSSWSKKLIAHRVSIQVGGWGLNAGAHESVVKAGMIFILIFLPGIAPRWLVA